MNNKHKEILQNLTRSVNSAVWFADNFVDIEMEPYQRVVLEAISTSPKVAWRSGHGVGKTTTAALAVLWFLSTRPHSKVITTASVWRQVAKQLWPEIHKWIKRVDWDAIGWHIDSFEKNITMLKIEEDWFATGEASDDPHKMEGFHAEHIMFVVDEAKSVPYTTFESIQGALTNAQGDTRLLVISTPPPRKSGYFWDIFSRKYDEWTLFHTSGLESSRVSPDWVEQRKKEWGEHSPIFQTRVLGEFAESSDDLLIDLNYIEDAIERQLDSNIDDPIIMGVDVARYGSDKSAFVIRKGQKVLCIETVSKRSITEVVGQVLKLAKKYIVEIIRVDVIGLGAGVADRLREVLQNQRMKIKVEDVNVSEKAKNSEQFSNKRAEIYDGLRLRFVQGDISIPDNVYLISQLSNISYEYTSRGQIKIESKDSIRSRGLVSPDIADALAMAFISTLRPKLRTRRKEKRNNHRPLTAGFMNMKF